MLQAWKARKVAQHTTHLGPQTVAFVDAQAAIAGAKNRLVPNLPGLIHQALIRFEPDVARAREEAAQTHREVRFDYHGETTGCPGSATLTAELDLVDGLDLDTAVTDLADHLGRLGDDSPLDERRARALGLLAHPQAVLDLVTDPAEPTEPTEPTDPTAAPPPRRGSEASWRSGPPPAPGSAPRPPRSTSTSTPRTCAATPRTATSPPARSRSSVSPASRPSPPGSAGPTASPSSPSST